MINKGGVIDIVFFVFIVVSLFGATLFSFLQNIGDVKAIVEDSRFVDEVYAKENEIEFYIYDTGGNILKEIKEGFTGTDEELQETILQEFPDKFITNIYETTPIDIPFNKFIEEARNGEFDFVYNSEKEVFEFALGDFVIIGDLFIDEGGEKRWLWRGAPVDFSEIEEEVIGRVIYRTDLEVKFDIDRLDS